MKSVNLRVPRPFGQRSNAGLELSPKKKYFLVVEGSRTELDYFNGVFDHRKELAIDELLDIIVVDREDENKTDSHPLHLLDGIKKRTGIIPMGDEYERINYDESIDEIWLIFDRDPGSFKKGQFEYILEQCRVHNFHIGLTHPNFEFWLLLHCAGIEQYSKEDLQKNKKINTRKRYIEKLLSDHLNGYNKNKIKFEVFKERIHIAIEQEKMFEQRMPHIFDALGSNIGVLLTKMMND